MEKHEQLYWMGQRIKARREALGMSQEILAEKVGYKSRSSINKIELGKNDIVQSTIQKLADALLTTPAALLGWEEEMDSPPTNAQPAPPKHSHEIPNPDIRMIARAGKKMTPEQAENLRRYAEFMFPEAFKDDDT